jgi:hypothetical protein
MGKVGDPEENARRFFDYAWVTNHKQLCTLRRLAKEQVADETWLAFLAKWEKDAPTIISEFERVKPQFERESKGKAGKRRMVAHWSGDVSLADRARAIGEEMPYRIAYAILCESVHSGATEALRYKFPWRGADPSFAAGPSPNAVRRSVVTACKFYLLALHAFGEAFAIKFKPYDDALDRMLRDTVITDNAE